jgi:hypothetical protein
MVSFTHFANGVFGVRMTKQEKLILLEKIYGSESAKMFKENMALSFKSIVPSSMVGSMALQKMTEDATGRKRIQP